MNSINILTFNVRGLQEFNKRQKVFQYIQDKIGPNGIAFIQETHSTATDESQWTSEWKGNILFSNYTSNARGVAILFTKECTFVPDKITRDTQGRIILASVQVNDKKLLLINLYNNNDQKGQLETIATLNSLLEQHQYDEYLPVFAGDFNLIFGNNDYKFGCPSLKRKSLAEIIKLSEKLDVCDIYRIRFPEKCRFTFCQKRPLLLRRLDYIFIPNAIQECVTKVDILPSSLSDHSPVFVTLCNEKVDGLRGKGYWKFNNNLLHEKEFVNKAKRIIAESNMTLEFDSAQLKWEMLKFRIASFSRKYSKIRTKKLNKRQNELESIIEEYEISGNT